VYLEATVNRKRMRTVVTILIILAFVSGGTVTLISALRGTTVDEPVTVLPGVTLTREDFAATGLGTAVDVQYAGKTFVFFPDDSADGRELAGTKSGITIDFRNGGSVTFLGGQFLQYSSPVVRDRAYAWYRDKVASSGLADDTGTAVVGDVSARYSGSDAAALLVRKNETVFTLLYTLTNAATTATSQPIVALEALARLLAARF
jgi:hypothetical protein